MEVNASTIDAANDEAIPHSVYVADWYVNIALRYNLQVARCITNEKEAKRLSNYSTASEEDTSRVSVVVAPKLPQRKFNNGFHYGVSKQQRRSKAPVVSAPAPVSMSETLHGMGGE